ncbi:30S ribosomal protein S21 [Longilinea arvoryzae]|uniref:30S ribosomal protein S21 n=1 Tax=Longilinea arvoryzae TaxID=360412 RepID=UPI001F00B427|nr:30S ribosomal protein S21 [Longilinea arvoryzae]
MNTIDHLSRLPCGNRQPSFFAVERGKSLNGREVSFLTFVIIRPNESQDQLLKRFRKKVVKSGVLSTVRRKRWFISKSELRRVEKKKAIRRIKRRQMSKMGE